MTALRSAPAVAEPRSATLERLRRMIRDIESRPGRGPSSWGPPRPPPALASAPSAMPLEALLPDVARRATAAGTCSYREARLPLGSAAVGEVPLLELEHATPEVLALLAPPDELDGAAVADLVFLDIETTGLGGAGAVAFLVATARVEDRALVLRQYLALTPPEEAALVDALLEDVRLEDDPVLATYNGRAFDAPMLDGRAVMHRRRAGFDALRHLDLLGPSRRIWRGRLPSCRLADVEWAMLRLSRRQALGCDDVPGFEVPGWYFRWLRSGDGRWLAPIARHNEMDVLALAGLLGRVAALLAGAATPDPPAALGLARLCHLRRHPAAEPLLERALAALPASDSGHARREALARLASLRKSAGTHDLAVPLWEEAAADANAYVLDRVAALVELAKHAEHRERRFDEGLAHVERALALLEAHAAQVPDGTWERRRAELEHRRARLERRAGRAPSPPDPLSPAGGDGEARGR